MSNTERPKNQEQNKTRENCFDSGTGQPHLACSGGKADYPLQGLISKPAPLGSDIYSTKNCGYEVFYEGTIWNRGAFGDSRKGDL
jgi:hypothetical protein